MMSMSPTALRRSLRKRILKWSPSRHSRRRGTPRNGTLILTAGRASSGRGCRGSWPRVLIRGRGQCLAGTDCTDRRGDGLREENKVSGRKLDVEAPPASGDQYGVQSEGAVVHDGGGGQPLPQRRDAAEHISRSPLGSR